MDLVTFLAAALALLATPGPTNTLLATSGASRGFRASLPLLVAEFAGYLLAILLLRIVLGPVITAAPVFGDVLRATVAVYLIHLAVVLWRHGGRPEMEATPVTFLRVLLATVMNPKAIIFAFTLLPQDIGLAGLSPWLFAQAVEIATVGAVWIGIGAGLRHGFDGVIHPKVGYRGSAAALVVLAGVIGGRALGAI